MKSFDTKPYRKKASALKQARQEYEAVWKDIREYLFPDSGKWLVDETNGNRHRDRDDDKILNDAGGKALDALARGLHGGLTSPSREWLRLALPDESLMEFGAVRVWLDYVRDLMRDVLARSNFYGAIDSLYREIGGYGTGALLVMEDDAQVIRCQALSVGQYYIDADRRGTPDTMYRRMSMTARQMAQEFGEENISQAAKDSLTRDRADQTFVVWHCVEPNESYRENDQYKLDFKWRSIWFEESCTENGKVLRVSGYREQPFVCPRWDVDADGLYGRGPGRRALPDVKQLQKVEKDKLYASELMVNPPVIGSASMEREAINLLPGGISFGDLSTDALRPVYQTNFRIDVAQALVNEVQDRIRQSFYVDLFMSIAAQEKQMTAREVAERSQEKLVMLGPVLERLQSEMLNPIIERVYGIMERKGLIPPVPEKMAGVILKIEYIGMLAQAQRLVGLAPMEQFIGIVGQVSQADPTALDKLNTDQFLDEYARDLGVPASIVRSDDDVEEIRQQRAQQQQAAQMQAQMSQAGQDAKTLSEVQTGGDNLLTDLLGGMGSVSA